MSAGADFYILSFSTSQNWHILIFRTLKLNRNQDKKVRFLKTRAIQEFDNGRKKQFWQTKIRK